MKPNSFLKYSLGLAFAATGCQRPDARHPINTDLRSLAR